MYDVLDDPSLLPQAYLRLAPSAPPTTPLAGDVDADCAVVGAGYTGLCAALHLAQRGARVVVLEGNTIGHGGSGRAFGQVVPYAKNDYRDTLARFGPEDGTRLIGALAEGPRLVFDLIEQHAIDCQPVRNGLIFAAHSRAGAATLERRAQWWSSRGAPVELLDRDGIERLTGTRLYSTAMIDRRGGTVMPLAYARGLATAAARAGATLHEGSPARAIDRDGAHWRVITPAGSVRAQCVIVATGAYTGALIPGLRASIIPLRAHQLVSQPLSQAQRAKILPGGQSLTDTRRLYSGVRLLPDGRLHLSVDGPAFDPRGRAFLGKASQRVRSLFPELHDLTWDEAWTGWVDMTVEEYPRLHEPAPGLWIAIGMSGRGIAAATLIGRELALRLAGEPSYRLMLPVTPIRTTPISHFARPLIGALMTWYRLLDQIDERSHLGARTVSPTNRSLPSADSSRPQ